MLNSLKITKNVPLAPFTTLGIGGRALFFAKAETEADVKEAVGFAAARGLELFILGGGSNILVSDSGFAGLVLQIAICGISLQSTGEDITRITVGAGEDWNGFTEFCVRNDLAGVECLAGIPGFVGGTPVQNVGAYGQEVSETIVSVRCFDRTTGEIRELTNAECGFKYRQSIFNTGERCRYIVLAVTFELKKGGKPRIMYPDLRKALELEREKGGGEATLAEVRQMVLKIRRAKSMVIDADDPNSKSAGSFFKNPVVPRKVYEDLTQKFGDVIPHFQLDDGQIKIPAAWLIEQSGFGKGFRLGNAGISSRHSLAIVNLGGASAAEVIALKDKIEHAVSQKFGISLMPEPVFVGF